MKYLDVNPFREISSSFLVRGSCSSTARAVEELLLAHSLCQCLDRESVKKMESQRRVEPEQELAPVSRRHLARLS